MALFMEEDLLLKLSTDEYLKEFKKLSEDNNINLGIKNTSRTQINKLCSSKSKKISFIKYLIKKYSKDKEEVKDIKYIINNINSENIYSNVYNNDTYTKEIKILKILYLFNENEQEEKMHHSNFYKSTLVFDFMEMDVDIEKQNNISAGDINNVLKNIANNIEQNTIDNNINNFDCNLNIDIDGYMGEDNYIDDDNNISIFIGIFKIENASFCNFYPKYIYQNINNKINITNINDKKTQFPPHGKISIINFPLELQNGEYSVVDNYVVVSLKKEEFEHNLYKHKALNKINYNKLKIKTLNDIDIYRITNEKIVDGMLEKSGQLMVTSDKKYIKGEKVILKYENEKDILYLEPKEIKYTEEYKVYYIEDDFKVSKIFTGYDSTYIDKLIVKEFKPYIDIIDDDTFVYIKGLSKNKKHIDIMPPEDMLKFIITEVGKSYSNKGSIDINNLDNIMQNMASSKIFNNKYLTSEDINIRKTKFIKYLSNIKDTEEFLNNFYDIIYKVILESTNGKFENNTNIEKMINYICQDTRILEKIQIFSIITDKLDILKKESDDLTTEIKILKKEKAEVSKKYIQQAEQNTKNITLEEKTNLEKIKSEKELILTELRALEVKYKELKNLDDIKNQFEKLNELHKATEVLFNTNTENLKKLDIEYLSKVDDIFKEDIVKNRIKNLENISKEENEQNDYNTAIEFINNKSCNSIDFTEIGKFFIDEVKKVRDYDNDEIINIFASVYTGFLTIFAGKPGTGKTSMCNIISQVLGLNDFGTNKDICMNKFVPISVERGWLSKRDFLGYFNPLTRQFDKSNKHLYDSLYIQDKELSIDNNKYPLIILLDEANLSPIEYYWGDFMKIADIDNNISNKLNIGNEIYLDIPKNMRFLATLNNDHTTETLSQRLLDRAWIIQLPKIKKNSVIVDTNYNLINNKPLNWNVISEFFESQKQIKISDNINNSLNEIYDILDNIDIQVSYRTKKIINNYISITSPLYDIENLKCLDYVVLQKLLPMINGSGQSYKEYLIILKEKCNSLFLKKSVSLLEQIITKGENNMSYFNYFN